MGVYVVMVTIPEVVVAAVVVVMLPLELSDWKVPTLLAATVLPVATIVLAVTKASVITGITCLVVMVVAVPAAVLFLFLSRAARYIS